MTYIRDMQESIFYPAPVSKDKKAKQGFTLVEVLVVIAIIGILGALGVTSMRDKVSVEAVKGEVVTIRSFLDEMSTRARAKDTSFSVKFVDDAMQYYLGVGCSGAVQGKIEINDRVLVKITNSTALPSAFTGTPLNWAASASCLDFTPRSRIGLNPLATDGYLVIYSGRNDKIRGLVGKVANTNKPLQFFSLNGGSIWSPQ